MTDISWKFFTTMRPVCLRPVFERPLHGFSERIMKNLGESVSL